MLFEDRVAIVSGAGPGLGYHTAKRMAREGAAVVLGARNEDRLKSLAAEIEAEGGRVAWSAGDIRDRDTCDRLVQTALDEFGRIDVLVNNAFRPDPMQPFVEADLDLWRKIFDVNVWGTLGLTQATVPHMQAQGGGAIVFILSMTIRKASGFEGAYGASKGALWAAARALARELGPDGIRINSVVPGWMKGPSVDIYLQWQAGERGVTPEEVEAEIAARTALNRVPTDEETAGAVLFLASDLSSGMTGQCVDVNGGEVFH
ncbi:MAG TPA: glucose 1-dehydrogenase [Acidimicrobiia bacterium]|nr:glucose 1-dehydrogenase [Acidimicrobiia bacterium]